MPQKANESSTNSNHILALLNMSVIFYIISWLTLRPQGNYCLNFSHYPVMSIIPPSVLLDQWPAALLAIFSTCLSFFISLSLRFKWQDEQHVCKIYRPLWVHLGSLPAWYRCSLRRACDRWKPWESQTVERFDLKGLSSSVTGVYMNVNANTLQWCASSETEPHEMWPFGLLRRSCK